MKSLSSFSSKSSKSRRPSADFDEETAPPTMKSLSMKSRPSMKSFSSKSSKSSSEELLPPAEVTVEVPYGFRAGDLLTVALPNSKKTTTLVIPEGCGPGSTLKVEPEVTVSVSIPRHVRAGDPVQAASPGGGTFAFIVPAGAKPGSRVTVSVPAKSLHAPTTPATDYESDGDDGESRTLSVKVPPTWDGRRLLSIAVDDGRRLTLQPPEGARPGDDLLVDVPLTEETVFKLAFRVPPFAHGGDIIGITTPSGRLAFVALPAGAESRDELVVRVSDVGNDDDEPAFTGFTPGGTKRASSKKFRAVLSSRLRTNPKPIMTELKASSTGIGLGAATKRRVKTQPMWVGLIETNDAFSEDPMFADALRV